MGTQHGKLIIIWALLGLGLLGSALFGTSVPAQAAPVHQVFSPEPYPVPGDLWRTFPETGQTVRGLFLDYWAGHGGLAQQGYPISGLLNEQSDLDGRRYWVQYFERAVFEYHPENPPPYNVLLSQLGTFEYQRRYPTGAPRPVPNQADNGRYFPQTGHWLGGKFRDYWESHGGLAQQGYPISDEFAELSPLNGQVYTVQYFERAVFEYHPENPPPYNVLLSQLGTFRHQARYGGPVGTPQPVGTPVPAPSIPPPTPSPTPVGSRGQFVGYLGGNQVVAAGGFLFWVDAAAPVGPLVGYDSMGNRKFVIDGRLTNKRDIVSNGQVVIWVDQPPNGGPATIEMYMINGGEQRTLLETPNTFIQLTDLVLDGGWLYYHSQGDNLNRIDRIPIPNGRVEEVVPTTSGVQVQPLAAAGGRLLWTEARVVGGRGAGLPLTTLHLSQPGSPTPDTVITAVEGTLLQARMTDSDIVWSFSAAVHGGDLWVHLYNIATGSTTLISDGIGQAPQIKGPRVVWTKPGAVVTGGPSQPWQINIYDIPTGRWEELYEELGGWGQAVALRDPDTVVYLRAAENNTREIYLLPVP